MNIRILRRMIMFRLDISSNLRIPCKAGIRAHGNKPSHGADIGYAVILPDALHDHLPFQIIFSDDFSSVQVKLDLRLTASMLPLIVLWGE